MASRFNLSNLSLICAWGGGAVMLAANRLGWATVQLLGGLMAVLGIILFGLDAVVSRRAEISAGQWGKWAFETYRGIPAIAWGLGMILLGVFAFWFNAAFLSSEEPDTIFHRHPALIVAVFGAVIALFGIGQAGRATVKMGKREFSVWRWDMRMGGLFSALCGLVICFLGLAAVIAPDWFWSTVRQAALHFIHYMSH